MKSPPEPLIDVLDENGLKTGETLSREAIHKLGKMHRAVFLCLFDQSDNLLLQRRSATTDHYSNMFSISLTGHVDSGESSSQALCRELKEELGLDADNMKFEFLFSFRSFNVIAPAYIDNQFNDVYACWSKFNVDDIAFDTKAITELKLVSFSEFRKMVAGKQADLVPVYAEMFTDLACFLSSKLKSW